MTDATIPSTKTKTKKQEKNRRYYETHTQQIKERAHKYYLAHREEIKERVHQYSQAHPEVNRAAHIRRVTNHRDKYNAYPRQYRIQNPDRASKIRYASKHRRRARNYSAPGSFSRDDVKAICAFQQGLCYWCGEPVGDDFQADHWYPISRGGTNWPENIVVSCPSCNRRKHDKLPWEWEAELND